MSRRLRLLLLIPVVLLVLPFAALVVISVFYSQEVKQLMISQLNRHLKTEITVADFDVSLLRNFPYASLEMTDVLMKEVAKQEPKDTLLYARRISLLFDVVSFYRKDYTVRRIKVSQGRAKITIRKDGSNNYEFWKSDSTSTGTEVDLSRVDISDVRVIFSNRQLKQEYDATLHDIMFSGTFGKARYAMKIKGDLFLERLSVDEVVYLREKEIQVATGLDVDAQNGHYLLQESLLRLADVDFSVAGDFTVRKDTRMDLRVEAREADLSSFISLLPQKYVTYFKEYGTSGKFVFNAAVKGVHSPTSHPTVTAGFSIHEGRLTPPAGEVSLKEIRLTGEYSSAGPGRLKVASLHARLGNQPLEAEFRVEDFANPFLELHAESTVELSNLKAFLRLDTLQELSGQAALNISFAGRIRDFSSVRAGNLSTITSSGAVQLRNTSFRLKDNPLKFESISGELQLQNTDIRVTALKGTISSSDFLFNGTFENLIPFVLNPEEATRVTASLNSTSIDLDELLTNKSVTADGDTAYKLAVDPRLSGNLDIRVGALKFRQFRASDLSGKVRLDRQVLTGQGLRFRAMQGQVDMDAVIDVSRRDSVRMSCDAKLRGLDIRQLFHELESFGQDILAEQHVRGKVTSTIQFRSSWTKDLVIDPASVKATCDITIENGQLTGFKPILELSKYIRLADLNDIRFSTLHNVISISDRKIIIPTMEIHSSALDLSCYGTHDFDNNIDYHFQLSLADILGRKYKQQQSEFGEVEDDGLGHTKLFLSMSGTVEHPKIKYDSKAVGQKLKEDVSREKQVIKDLLREEFKSLKKDSVKKSAQPVKKKEELEIEW